MAGQVTREEGARIYAEQLKGQEGPECPIPGCAGSGRMICTGWLVFSTKYGWQMESTCPDHGPGFSFGGPLWPLFREILKNKGLEG
ncbi:MAG: hypothetical protein EHM45_01545 [Desulfobacteraceae bacterium]|nr:MAG: hypothetical protein EHM45_01545 [Desulfobacteraceae bacterium]